MRTTTWRRSSDNRRPLVILAKGNASLERNTIEKRKMALDLVVPSSEQYNNVRRVRFTYLEVNWTSFANGRAW
jgi:hypothetical protein